MHRVLADKDYLPLTNEIHGLCGGTSIGVPFANGLVNPGGALGIWRMSNTVGMGPRGVHPLGAGHDGGPGRLHVLVCAEPHKSVLASAVATATAGVKPPFSAHRTQVNVSGAMLPICVDPTPFGVGTAAAMFCGGPQLPSPYLIPSVTTVQAGMTAGDLVGGAVNAVAEAAWSLQMAALGQVGGTAGRVVAGIVRALGGGGPVESIVHRMTRVTDRFRVGPSGLGGLPQAWIDGDGVGSDARPYFGFGWLGTVEGGSNEGPGRWVPPVDGTRAGNGEAARGVSESWRSAYGRERLWR
jgi:hypothetical protein